MSAGRPIKTAGRSATESRRGTLHGSGPKRRMAKWGGRLQRLAEKPAIARPVRPGRGRSR